MTMTEKILAKHSDKSSVTPGDNVWTSVDKLLTHDVCGPGTFGIFQKEFGENAQVGRDCWDQLQGPKCALPVCILHRDRAAK